MKDILPEDKITPQEEKVIEMLMYIANIDRETALGYSGAIMDILEPKKISDIDKILSDEEIDRICSNWIPKLSKSEKALMQYGLIKARDIYEPKLQEKDKEIKRLKEDVIIRDNAVKYADRKCLETIQSLEAKIKELSK